MLWNIIHEILKSKPKSVRNRRKIHISFNCVVRKLGKCVRKTRIFNSSKKTWKSRSFFTLFIMIIRSYTNHNCSSVKFECQLGRSKLETMALSNCNRLTSKIYANIPACYFLPGGFWSNKLAILVFEICEKKEVILLLQNCMRGFVFRQFPENYTVFENPQKSLIF